MGKFKVSFTTILFVFSFIICVVVAVVFVDRGPRNDYDSFYESAIDSDSKEKRSGDNAWSGEKKQFSQPDRQQQPSATAALTLDEQNFADLPLDPHLRAAAQPVDMTPAPAPTANPMQGRSPEEIARMYLNKTGVYSPSQANNTAPDLAVPPGINTPAAMATVTATPVNRVAHNYLPLQSNEPSNPMAGPGMGAMPASGYSSTNVSDGWSAVSPRSTPDSMMGIRSAPSNPQSGMMISQGSTETGAHPPAEIPDHITRHTPQPLSTSAPGGGGSHLLLAPPPADGNKWELPPTPTLPPPLIQDPDRQRSEADPDPADSQSPGSVNPESSLSQALAISEIADEESGAEAAEPEYAALVNNRKLTMEQALKLAEVQHVLNDEILTEDNRESEAKKAAQAWADITAAAELARANGISLPAPDVEKYAGMRPDFDPAAWQAAMAEKGFATSEIRQQLMDIALSEKLVELDFIETVTDEDVRKAYDKSPSKYASAKKVHLQEIYKDKPDDEARAEKVAAAMKRLQRQAAAGTDFGLLARQASELASRQKGGDLGWITPSEEKDELRDKAIAELKPGQVSDVVEEPDGYRIYRLVDVKQATDDFDGGRDLVIADLKKDIRTDSLASAREKLEKGEPLVKENIKTAGATQTANEPPDKDAASKPADKKTGAADPQDAARKAVARQVLAEQAERRRESGEANSHDQPQQPAAGPVMVSQQRAPASQLLYAPGSQVQQMTGGQPAPPQQPGGQAPAAPVFDPMTAPSTVRVTGGPSVNYSPGQTMHIGGNSVAPGNLPAGGTAAGQDVGNSNTPFNSNYSDLEMAAMQATAMSAQQPERETQTPQITQDNGWTVTKSSNSRRPEGNPDTADAYPAGYGAGGDVISAGGTGTVPPGFEVGDQPQAPAAQPAENEQENRGIIGNVKSFFGGFRR